MKEVAGTAGVERACVKGTDQNDVRLRRSANVAFLAPWVRPNTGRVSLLYPGRKDEDAPSAFLRRFRRLSAGYAVLMVK